MLCLPEKWQRSGQDPRRLPSRPRQMGRWECSQQFAWQELVYVTSCSIDGRLEMIACFESFLVSQFSYSFATNMENLFMSKSFSQICCGNNSLLKKHHEGVLSFQRMCSWKDKRVFKTSHRSSTFRFWTHKEWEQKWRQQGQYQILWSSIDLYIHTIWRNELPVGSMLLCGRQGHRDLGTTTHRLNQSRAPNPVLLISSPTHMLVPTYL